MYIFYKHQARAHISENSQIMNFDKTRKDTAMVLVKKKIV